MSTKDQVKAAALTRFRTETVQIGDTQVVMRELSVKRRGELDRELFVYEGEKAKETDKGNLILKTPGVYTDPWLAATMTTTDGEAFTVDDFADWPDSLKDVLLKIAHRLNGVGESASIAKN